MSIFIGGTGTANELDDYEEGTWTPVSSEPSFHVNVGTYVKIGTLVHLDMWCQASSTTASTASIYFNLPFSVQNTNASRPVTGVARVYSLQNWGSQRTAYGFTTSGSSDLNMMWVGAGSNPAHMNNNLWRNGAEIHMSMSYRTQ
tara:strand:+ start:53 stop:484 length:432 start_codon:yes stop_codon:yes gene_type:complete